MVKRRASKSPSPTSTSPKGTRLIKKAYNLRSYAKNEVKDMVEEKDEYAFDNGSDDDSSMPDTQVDQDIFETFTKGQDMRLRTSFVMDDNMYNQPKDTLPSLADPAPPASGPSPTKPTFKTLADIAEEAPKTAYVADWLKSSRPTRRVPEVTQQMPGAWASFGPNEAPAGPALPTGGTSTVADPGLWDRVYPLRHQYPFLHPTYTASPQPAVPKKPAVVQKKPAAVEKKPAVTTKGILTKGTQKQPSRIGYGFSYSMVSEIADSEDSEMSEVVVNDDPSFRDNLVFRGTSDFSFHKPATILRCTAATFTDTMQMQCAASSLLKHTESADVFGSISNRIERMVTRKFEAVTTSRGTLKRGEEVPSTHECTIKLRDWLKKELENRVEVGEQRSVLEHELEWAEWFVEAAKKGVLHLKVAGCKCRPEWESKWGDIKDAMDRL